MPDSQEYFRAEEPRSIEPVTDITAIQYDDALLNLENFTLENIDTLKNYQEFETILVKVIAAIHLIVCKYGWSSVDSLDTEKSDQYSMQIFGRIEGHILSVTSDGKTVDLRSYTEREQDTAKTERLLYSVLAYHDREYVRKYSRSVTDRALDYREKDLGVSIRPLRQDSPTKLRWFMYILKDAVRELLQVVKEEKDTTKLDPFIDLMTSVLSKYAPPEEM